MADEELKKLTEYRRSFLEKRSEFKTNTVKRLEAEYGKYLFVPFDIEPIKPDNPARFAEWYFHHAKQVTKKFADVAGPAGGANYSGKTFLGISSMRYNDPIWEENSRGDLFVEFPEIKEKLKQLPFSVTPEYTLWSSQRTVNLHRDQGPWVDIPSSFRVSLYDENPHQTLFIREELPDGKAVGRKLMLPSELNSFAWNNLRVKHGSTYDPQYRKILMIIGQHSFDFDKYEKLIQRSLSKFGATRFVSLFTRSNFTEN